MPLRPVFTPRPTASPRGTEPADADDADLPLPHDLDIGRASGLQRVPGRTAAGFPAGNFGFDLILVVVGVRQLQGTEVFDLLLGVLNGFLLGFLLLLPIIEFPHCFLVYLNGLTFPPLIIKGFGIVNRASFFL